MANNMKRFRDKNGCLTHSWMEVAFMTREEGEAYYKEGCMYRFECDNKLYECTGTHGEDGKLLYFTREDGGEMGVPKVNCGTFLPTVASEGCAMVRVADQE